VAADLRASQSNARIVVVLADLAAPGGAEALHREVAAMGVDVVLLAANAGVAWTGAFVRQPASNLRSMLDLNVGATAVLCRLFGADMSAAGRGRLLLVASVAGTTPGVPGTAAYAASKAFIRALAAGLRGELRGVGVGVTCLLPGATDSGFAAAAGMERALCFNLPLARELGVVSTAEDVAERAVEAALRGDAECIPGALNAFFAGLPAWVSGPIAEAMFADAPWLRGDRPTRTESLAPVAAVALVLAAPHMAHAAGTAGSLAHVGPPMLATLTILASLFALKVCEKGSPDALPIGEEHAVPPFRGDGASVVGWAALPHTRQQGGGP